MINSVIMQDMKDIESRSEDWSWLWDKAVLVSGAYGMLPSYIVYFLIYLNETHPEHRTDIVAVGRNAEKMKARFGRFCSKEYFHILNADICGPIRPELHIDYIIHAASPASPQYYSVSPVNTLLPNTLGTYNLLELARRDKSLGLLFFSSGDVYGKVPDDTPTVTETDYGYIDPMNVRSCYGESKRMGETMCKAWSHQYGVPAKSVRIYHTYGPTLDLANDKRMFAEFVNNIVNSEDIVMKSDGSAVRAFCYIADATDAFFRILKDGDPGTAYNMCNSGCRISVAELAQTLVSLFPEKELKVRRVERAQNSSYMESTVKVVTKISTERLESLGWKPKYDIKAGFGRTINSFVQE